MADIARIKSINGVTYDIKDEEARQLLTTMLSGALMFKGITTTELEDGSTVSSVTIDGSAVTAENGFVVLYDNKEFVYSTFSNPAQWLEFGDNTALGAFAYVDQELLILHLQAV